MPNSRADVAAGALRDRDEGPRRLATRFCMPTQEYQRHCWSFLQMLVSARTAQRRSTVIGWWIVATVGARRLRAQMP